MYKQILSVVAAGLVAFGVCQYGAIMQGREQNEQKPQEATHTVKSEYFVESEADQTEREIEAYNEKTNEPQTYVETEMPLEKSDQAVLQEESVMPILTERNSASLATVTQDGYAGTIECEKWGLSCPVYYSGPVGSNTIRLSQAHVDAKNSADLFGKPFGVKGSGSFVGEHNTQTGYLFGRAKIGDIVYVTTPYGEYAYKIARANYGHIVVNGSRQVYDDVTGQNMQNTTHDLILYTCYPFNAWKTDRRWIVYGDLLGKVIVP